MTNRRLGLPAFSLILPLPAPRAGLPCTAPSAPTRWTSFNPSTLCREPCRKLRRSIPIPIPIPIPIATQSCPISFACPEGALPDSPGRSPTPGTSCRAAIHGAFSADPLNVQQPLHPCRSTPNPIPTKNELNIECWMLSVESQRRPTQSLRRSGWPRQSYQLGLTARAGDD